MRISVSVLALPALVLALSASGAAATYKIDPSHSGASFTVRHLMISNVRGVFGNITGTVEYDPENPAASKVDASIDVSTIDTRQPKRDAHLKSADFFDVEKFPAMRFVSKRLIPASPGKLKLLGDLTLHGVTREVALDVEGPTPEMKDDRGTVRMGASATTRISRKDFGMTWNRALETGGIAGGDEVNINIELELIRAK
jgi:polyisoprenoid-binding protein YceI